MSWAEIIIGIVALQRISEFIYARNNKFWLLQVGAEEVEGAHYPLIVALQCLWLITVFFAASPYKGPIWWLIGVYVAVQAFRYWAMISLRGFWTLQIIDVPHEPLIRTGPYRFLRHPNYAVVIAETAVLPLAFREPWVAVIFSIVNLALLAWLVTIEDRLLEARRG